eukprot:gene1388-2761_t
MGGHRLGHHGTTYKLQDSDGFTSGIHALPGNVETMLFGTPEYKYFVADLTAPECSVPRWSGVAGWSGVIGRGVRCGGALVAGAALNGKAQFLNFDVDGTNELSRSEIGRLCTWLNYPHADHDIDRMFRVMDADGNGTIDFQEYVTYMKDNRPNPEVQLLPAFSLPAFSVLYNMNRDEYEAVSTPRQPC